MTPVALFELILALLGAALLLSLVAGRLGFPPAAALVLGGMVLAVAPGLPAFDLDPDLIMVLFLPPLLLESAYFTVWRDFRASLGPILSLSLGAVLFTTLAVGLVAHAVAPALPWAACFALGAIVSPPDAVAAKAVLARVALPRRMVTVLEGESLVNDASGLVLYRFAVAAALTGSFSAWAAAGSFAWLAVAGVAVGLVSGLAVNALVRRLHDANAVTVLSFLAAYAAYLAAEEVHASGVLAVVACGLMLGGREHETFDAHVRRHAVAVWEFVVFVLEALVFVLIGLALRGVLARTGGEFGTLAAELPLALAVTAACVVARLIWVFPAVYLRPILSARVRAQEPPPDPRGAADRRLGRHARGRDPGGRPGAAGGLPRPRRDPGRGLRGDPVHRAGAGHHAGAADPPAPPRPRRRACPTAISTRRWPAWSSTRRGSPRLEGLVSPETGALQHPRLVEEYRRRVRATSRDRDERAALEAEKTEHFAAALLAVRSGRSALIALHRENRIHSSVLRQLETEIDLEELHLKRLAGTAPAQG